jgi:DNA mismatch repair protein MSH5
VACCRARCPTNKQLDNESEAPLPYHVEIRPSPEFDYENALNRLLGICSLSQDAATELLIPGEAMAYDEDLQPADLGWTTGRGKLMQLSAWLNLDNKASIGCAGAIISYLQRRSTTIHLSGIPEFNTPLRVNRMEMFSLKETMLVNTDTLMSLQIIGPESHPNPFIQGAGTSGAKESLSIYGLFQQFTRTPHGKVRLRQALLRPSLNFEEIKLRLDFVSVFSRPENQTVCDQLSKSLRGVKNMRNTVTLLRKGIDGGKSRHNAFKNGV